MKKNERNRNLMGGRRMIGRLLRVYLALSCVVVMTSVRVAGAAPFGELLSSGSGGGAQLVRAREVHQRALESFRETAAEVAKEELPAQLQESGAQSARVQREVWDFSRELRRKLRELGGDGVLTLEEVQDEVAELRASHVNQLTESLKALADGSPAPPKQGASEGFWRFSWRQLRYTFWERNPPLKSLWLLAWILGGLGLTAATSYLLKKWTRKSDEPTTMRRVLKGLRGPFYLAATVGASWIWLSSIWVPIEIAEMGKTLSLLGFGVAVVWYFWRLSNILPEKVLHGEHEQHSYELFRTLSRMVCVGLFAIYVVEVIVGTDFTALVAGFGIAGFALTLAAQDGLKNLFGAGTIHADRLFRVGQLVRFRDFFGPIEHIGFRSVKLRTLDGHLVTIPNAVLAEDAVENVSARPYIRREAEIGIVYDTPPQKMNEAIEIVRGVLEESEHVHSDHPIRVAFDEFSDYSLNLAILYHHQETDYWKAKENDSELNVSILQKFDEAGIEFAFPTRTLHVDGSLKDERSRAESPPDSGARTSAN